MPPEAEHEVTTTEGEQFKLRTFANALMVMEDGQFNEDLTEAQKEVIHAMNDAVALRGGKAKGSLTIKIEFELEDGIINAKTAFTVSKPKVPRSKSIFWTTKDGLLTTANPRQRMLPFGQVTGGASAFAPAQAIRQAGGAAG